jgi:hypothetical protein
MVREKCKTIYKILRRKQKVEHHDLPTKNRGWTQHKEEYDPIPISVLYII